MKEKELREAATCIVCGKKIGASSVPIFWRVRIQRWALDMKAITRQQGLTMVLGGHAVLASVMGPDEDMAKQIFEVEMTVCEECGSGKRLPIAALAEKANEEGI